MRARRVDGLCGSGITDGRVFVDVNDVDEARQELGQIGETAMHEAGRVVQLVSDAGDELAE